jgi:hypothetical protein
LSKKLFEKKFFSMASKAGAKRFPLGVYKVFDIKGNEVQTGSSARVRIVRSRQLWIKYKRKDARFDPAGTRRQHGKVTLIPGVSGVYRVNLGGYQHIRSDGCVLREN